MCSAMSTYMCVSVYTVLPNEYCTLMDLYVCVRVHVCVCLQGAGGSLSPVC